MKKNHLYAIVFLALLVIKPGTVFSYSPMNPFVSPTVVDAEKTEQSNLPKNPFFRKVSLKISAIQADLNEKLTEYGKEVKNNPSPKIILLSLFIAFLFGMIHALGPGHGKVFSVTYFMAQDAKIKTGVLLGSMVAFMHAGLAILLVAGVYFILKHSYLVTIENFSQVMKIISYVLISLLGGFLLFTHIREFIRKRKGITEEDRIDRLMKSNKNVYTLALAIGMIPCPGTTLLLLFAISLDMIGFGILLSIVMAIGMAITISAIGMLTIAFRKGSVGLVSKASRWKETVAHSLEIAGSVIIMFFGLGMLIAAF